MSAEPGPAPPEPDAVDEEPPAVEDTTDEAVSDDIAVEHNSLTVADDPLDKPAESDA